ncbi:MAG: hypothetical protein V4475_07830 [Pseudomonadota bacterium]
MPRQLKVYRTPIGFHDAYVAAPSQKAALEAWGTDANLFARGVAELVTDPALTREPLASPGTVVRRLRGSADDHFAALPRTRAKRPRKAEPPADDAPARSAPTPRAAKAEAAPQPPKSRPPPSPKPRPSRAKLDAAEEALDAIDRRHREELAAMRRREEALAKERRAIEQRQAREVEKLMRARERVKEAYDRAIARWRD